MALEIKLTREQTENRFPLDSAYAKVVRVQIDTSAQDQVLIDVAIYGDSTARRFSGASTVDKRRVRCSLAQLNPKDFTVPGLIGAAYAYLKAQGWAGKDV